MTAKKKPVRTRYLNTRLSVESWRDLEIIVKSNGFRTYRTAIEWAIRAEALRARGVA